MKFLVFNVIVAAALIFLFTTDRAQVEDTAGRIHDAASEVKERAEGLVDKGRRLIRKVPGAAGRDTSDAAAPEGREPLAKHALLDATPLDPPAMTRPAGEGRGKEAAAERPAAAPPAKDESEAARPPAPKPPVLPAAARPDEAYPEQAAALKRREEILRGIDPAVLGHGAAKATATVKAEPSAPAMPPAERRKQLYALSEEMELFYAKSLGR
jgi:hypothetical protein